MKTSVTTLILIGILVVATAHPLILIPVMAIGMIVVVIYRLVHDVIMPALHNRQHKHNHAH